MRYVYDGSRWAIDVGKGKVEWYRYVVVARDAQSVVIRTTDPLPLPIDDLSEFTVIHFEGNDRYWVDEQVTGYREYFRRVK